MPPLPTLSGRDVVEAFSKAGWQMVRQRGSPMILVKEGHTATLSVNSVLPGQQRERSPFSYALSSFLNGFRPNGQSADAWATANRGFPGSQEPRFRTVQKLGHVLQPSEVFTFADHQGFPLHGEESGSALDN